jgi:hypothetical protein
MDLLTATEEREDARTARLRFDIALLAARVVGASDWLTLAQVGTSDTTYLQWVYVGGGANGRTWTVAMPTTPGQYEFRFYPNNGFVRAATSPAVTVIAVNPTPSISSLSPAAVTAGSAPVASAMTWRSENHVDIVPAEPAWLTVIVIASGDDSAMNVSHQLCCQGPIIFQVTNPSVGLRCRVRLPLRSCQEQLRRLSRTHSLLQFMFGELRALDPRSAGDFHLELEIL